MAAALTFTAAAMPAGPAGTAGIAASGNSNGDAGAAWTYAGGAPGALDTVANAELLKGLATTSRLYALLSPSYATQAALDAAIATAGLAISCNGAHTFKLITAAPGVPTATVTTVGATGMVSMAMYHTIPR